MEKINLTTDKLAAAATAKSLQSFPTLCDPIETTRCYNELPTVAFFFSFSHLSLNNKVEKE